MRKPLTFWLNSDLFLLTTYQFEHFDLVFGNFACCLTKDDVQVTDDLFDARFTFYMEIKSIVNE